MSIGDDLMVGLYHFLLVATSLGVESHLVATSREGLEKCIIGQQGHASKLYTVFRVWWCVRDPAMAPS